MKCNIRVSVITPVYNGVEHIRDTIESVLGQAYKNIEYIVVDGGSTDGTMEIVKEYEPLFHGRMKYVSEKDIMHTTRSRTLLTIWGTQNTR